MFPRDPAPTPGRAEGAFRLAVRLDWATGRLARAEKPALAGASVGTPRGSSPRRWRGGCEAVPLSGGPAGWAALGAGARAAVQEAGRAEARFFGGGGARGAGCPRRSRGGAPASRRL